MQIKKLNREYPDVYKALEDEWGDVKKINKSIKKIENIYKKDKKSIWHINDSVANYWIVKKEVNDKEKYYVCESLIYLKIVFEDVD